MHILLGATGTLIVLITLLDVFFTVLFPASGHGPIRKPVEYAVWRLFRLIGAKTTGQRRRNLLSYSGPVLIAATLAVWFCLLVIGWAMIYKPALGTAIRASSGPTDTSWATAFYYSGFNLTTLGVGDLTAKTDLYRLLTVIEAAVGFAFFSMVITYFLSVYSSLTGRNAFAQGLHHLTGQSGNAATLLARLADGGDLPGARQHFSSKAEFIRQTYQTHRFYPILRYFHYRETYYALPRVLLTALDAATLVRSALDQERYACVIRSPELDDLFQAAMALLHGLVPGARGRPPSADEAVAWQRRYAAAAAQLADAGLQVRADTAAGSEEYVKLRSAWDWQLHDLARLMLYEWDDIE